MAVQAKQRRDHSTMHINCHERTRHTTKQPYQKAINSQMQVLASRAGGGKLPDVQAPCPSSRVEFWQRQLRVEARSAPWEVHKSQMRAVRDFQPCLPWPQLLYSTHTYRGICYLFFFQLSPMVSERSPYRKQEQTGARGANECVWTKSVSSK